MIFDGDTIPAGTFVRGNIHNFGGGDVLLMKRGTVMVSAAVLVITRPITLPLRMLHIPV